MAIVFTITDAGRAALVDPDNNGTNAVVIAEVGLGSGRYAPTKDQTELQSPIKRVDTIAGQAVSDDTLHVTVQDETSDAYQVGEIGLFTDAGVLFAVYSQSDWIIEKAAPATLLLATDLVVESLDVSSITFGDAAFLNPPATTTVKGVLELATQEEVDAGTDRLRAVVPRTLKAFIDRVLAAYATVKQLTDHAASRDHPAANTNNQGMVELATVAEAKEGTDNTRAITPAADKAALDQHRTETGAHAADRISLGTLSTLGNPKTVQAAMAALGSAALRNEGSGGGLDADKLDGQELDVFYRSNTSNPSIRMGSGSDTNWDGIVYNEGDNTLAFYADQEVGRDTPRVLLGPGYIEAAGDRFYDNGDLTVKGKAKAGTLEVSGGVSFGSELNMHNSNIVNANKVTINDEGFGEGFMLPNWEFSESGGNAYVRDSKNSHIVMEFAPDYVRAVDGFSVGTGVDTTKSFWNGKGIALGDNDSGIRQSSDGVIELWGNNSRALYINGAGETVATGELVVGSSKIRLGSGGSTNWDGIVYDEGDNTLSFYADQEPGKDTPRVKLGPGWIEASGRRVWHEGDVTSQGGKSGGRRRLPNGDTEMWGYVTTNTSEGSPTSVTFPYSFDSACYNVSITPVVNPNVDVILGVNDSPSRTGFTAYASRQSETSDSSVPGFFWRAIGR
ncbi:gp53-like domain-containing protein [Salinicola acroporae]|nr:hypothetical protein [Salinicola acroporae]